MSLLDVARVVLLLFSLWAAGIGAECTGCPALVAEIIVGILLGPPVADWVPHTAAISTAGLLGLHLLVLEGALHIDLTTLRRIGLKASAIALSGTTLPVLASWGILPLFSEFSRTEALVAGTALSSTAIGMAAKMMQGMDMLGTPTGKLICCAAMIDDVASLVLLAMITAYGEGANTPAPSPESKDDHPGWGPRTGLWAALLPLFSSIAFVAFSAACARRAPRAVGACLRAAPAAAQGGAPVALLLLLFVWASALTLGAFYARTTPLLGTFMAGVCFASVRGTAPAWEQHAAPVSAWLSRVFFASVGFAIPAASLFESSALGFGALLTVVAVLSKVVTGVWEWKSKWVIGWAMVGRGELGFVMAEEGYKTGVTSKLAFSVTVWALLLATLLSPLALRAVLARQPPVEAAAGSTSADTGTGAGAQHTSAATSSKLSTVVPAEAAALAT
eukprot:g4307.t1